MPKKTSRAARTLQAQRGIERKSAARPLVDPENSRLVADSARLDSLPYSNGTTLVEEAEVEGANEVPGGLEVKPAITSVSREIPAATSSTIRPATRRPYARRTTANVNRQPVLSREEEYSFIRSDLLTVFLLTVLMIIILVVLTILIGR